MANVTWCLSCLGAPCLMLDGGTAEPLVLARKDTALLAYVGLNSGVVSARAADVLWPDSTERGALNNLRQRLHRLRKATDARLLEVAEHAHLASDLRLQAVPDEAALQADPNAWNGELLEGVNIDGAAEFSAWLLTERAAWVGRRREALAAIAAACEKSGEVVRALAYAHRLLVDDPLSEYAHRRLMRLHYLRGDRGAAIAAFESCERTLKDELGLKPSAETLQLLETVERGMLPAPARAALQLPASLLRPPRTVGRQSERGQLAQAHADGHIAALVGEAGMGKTRLLQDFIATQPQAVYAQARPGDAAVPYGALARLLRAVLAAAPAAIAQVQRGELARVAPELGERLDNAAPGQPSRLQAAIEQLLAAALASDVQTLAVDDLHFADPASIEMLRVLVDSDRLDGMRWAFAHRPLGAADENGALLQSLADSPRARWIVLAPLTDGDLVELLEQLALPGIGPAEFAPALARHTGGNPLYVLETLREARLQPLADGDASGRLLPRPQTIAHMIDRRLQRLSASALALARVAALAGADFTTQLAEHALGTPALLLAGAWAELEAADVLRGNAFAHDLVRDGMLRATPAPIAVHAHRLIAQYLERNGAEPARVAAHWLEGGEHTLAARAFESAASQARLAGRPREQTQLLLCAGDAFEAGGDADNAIMMRAQAVRFLLQCDGTARALVLSQQLIDVPQRHRHAALVWANHATACLWAGQVTECEAAARKALALSRPQDDAVRMEAVRTAAQACGLQGRADEGLELLRGWDERIEDLDDPDQRIEFCAAYENLMIQADRPVDSLPWTHRHLRYAEQAGDISEQMSALMNLAGYFMRQGDMEQGVAYSRRAAAIAPPTEQARALASWNDSARGYMLCGAGRYDEAIAILEAELEHTAVATNVLRANQEHWLAQVLVTLGQPARARQRLGADEAMPPGLARGRRLIARAMVQRALGLDDTALLEEAVEASRGPNASYERFIAQVEIASRLEPSLASVECEGLEHEARQREYWPIVLKAGRARMNALLKLGEAEPAAVLAQAIEDLIGRYQHPMTYPPEYLHACALAYERSGRHADVQRCLAAALHWVHSVALPHVPEHFRHAFLERNPVNVALAKAFARQRGA